MHTRMCLIDKRYLCIQGSLTYVNVWRLYVCFWITDSSVKMYKVSVTTDGQRWSSEKDLTVYDSKCKTCNSHGVCTQKVLHHINVNLVFFRRNICSLWIFHCNNTNNSLSYIQYLFCNSNIHYIEFKVFKLKPHRFINHILALWKIHISSKMWKSTPYRLNVKVNLRLVKIPNLLMSKCKIRGGELQNVLITPYQFPYYYKIIINLFKAAFLISHYLS